MSRLLKLMAGALLLVSCGAPGTPKEEPPAAPGEFVAGWRGLTQVRTTRDDGSVHEKPESLYIGILPDPDNPQGIVVVYRNLPLKADIRGRRFIVREGEEQKLTPLFGMISLLAGEPVRIENFHMEGKLLDSTRLEFAWDYTFARTSSQANFSHRGTLQREPLIQREPQP